MPIQNAAQIRQGIRQLYQSSNDAFDTAVAKLKTDASDKIADLEATYGALPWWPKFNDDIRSVLEAAQRPAPYKDPEQLKTFRLNIATPGSPFSSHTFYTGLEMQGWVRVQDLRNIADAVDDPLIDNEGLQQAAIEIAAALLQKAGFIPSVKGDRKSGPMSPDGQAQEEFTAKSIHCRLPMREDDF